MLLARFFEVLTQFQVTEARSPMKLPANRVKRFSAIALAPLAIIVLVLSMAFSAHSRPAPNSTATAVAAPAALPAASPNASPDPQGGQIISCSSDNMRRNYCAADVRGGVQLVRQRSDRPASSIAPGASSTDAASGSIAAAAQTSQSRAPTGAAGTTATTFIARPTTAAATLARPTRAAACS